MKHDLCLFYKLVNNLVILDVHDSSSFRESYRGQSRMLFVNFSRIEKRKFYWIHRIVGYRNSLNNDIVNAPSIAVFKRLLTNAQFTGSMEYVLCVTGNPQSFAVVCVFLFPINK